MTKAGKKWIGNAIFKIDPTYPDRNPIEYKSAERLLRAFCEEVEKRAMACVTASPECKHPSMSGCYGKAFRELKRELIGRMILSQ